MWRKLAGLLLVLAIIGGLVYLFAHFVIKYW